MNLQNAPLVSILIPCFNAEKYVGEAIHSALAQTHSNVEVVVVDDGSIDGSRDVISRFGGRIIAEFGPNRGACVARNRALALSKGDYIQFLDADDVLAANKIERQLPYLMRDEADLVCCHCWRFGPGEEPWLDRGWPPPEDGEDSFLYLMKYNPGTNGPLHRRSHIEAVGGFRPGLRSGLEWDLHMRIGASDVRLRLLDERLVGKRHHDGPQITKQPRHAARALLLLLTIASELEESDLLTPQRSVALSRLLMASSVGAYRSGHSMLAGHGFAHARRLWPGVPHPGGRCIQVAAGGLGSQWAESIRAALNSLRGRRTCSPFALDASDILPSWSGTEWRVEGNSKRAFTAGLFDHSKVSCPKTEF